MIEEFFKALKTGCAYERRQLESARALVNALAVFVPVAFRLLYLRSLARHAPDASARKLLTDTQLHVLHATSKRPLPAGLTARQALAALAALGGHIKNNGDPGWLVLGRGYEKLLYAEYVWNLATSSGVVVNRQVWYPAPPALKERSALDSHGHAQLGTTRARSDPTDLGIAEPVARVADGYLRGRPSNETRAWEMHAGGSMKRVRQSVPTASSTALAPRPEPVEQGVRMLGTRMRAIGVFALVCTALACQAACVSKRDTAATDAATPEHDAEPAPEDSGDPDAEEPLLDAGSDDAGEEAGPPILGQPARDPLSCRVVSSFLPFTSPPDASVPTDAGTEPLVGMGGNNVVRERSGTLWMQRLLGRWRHLRGASYVYPAELRLSASDESGRLTTDRTLATLNTPLPFFEPRRLLALPNGGLALVWPGNGDEARFTVFDAAGDTVVDGTISDGTQPLVCSPPIAELSQDGAIRVSCGSGASRSIVVLDQQGQVVAGPHAIDPASVTFFPPPDAGSAILRVRSSAVDPAAAQELLFTKLGAAGEVVGEQPVASVPAPSEDVGRIAGTTLYPVDDGYLALWTESKGDKGVFGAPVGYSVIWTRLLGPEGEPRSAAAPLNAREEDVDERRPALTRVGDLLGLFWVRGQWSVDCEWDDACEVKDSGRFVLLDPRDLTPRSEVIEIARDPSYSSYPSYPSDSGTRGASPELARLGGIEEVQLLPAADGVLITATLVGQSSTPTDVGFAKIACD